MNKDKKDLLSNELIQILEKMIEDEDDITIRKVVERSYHIKSPTTITRDNPKLREIFFHFKTLQKDSKEKLELAVKSSNRKLAAALTNAEIKNKELEAKFQLTLSAFVAVIRASGEFGGGSAWIELYDGYQKALDETFAATNLEKGKVILGNFKNTEV
nr:hypothetical protein [uncultured Undibacterium sp.]